ncbi:MAG: 30S ribosomal protein S27ae [Methanobacteriota archaeon]
MAEAKAATPPKAPKGSVGIKRTLYKVDGDRIVRTRTSCPKCGAGVFLAVHEGRVSCGRCGYTEFAKK